MATIVLAAAGATIGSGFGGAVFGLSGAVIGRAVGASLGRVIDQRLLGAGSQAVETGRVERFRLTGAGEGAPIARVWGRMRLGGQVIWASGFVEDRAVSGGGKGTARPATISYSYSVSLAIALCEGEITGIGRIWADGVEIGREELTLRVYRGTPDQLPDPKIEAVEGAGTVPAYRGIAYVVIEDLALGRFGNRVPQFSFEVVRRAAAGDVPDLTSGLRAVALMPGTGEYALATTPVHYAKGPGENVSANVNSPSGMADVETSLVALREELPNVASVSLIVSWFGDDLRCGLCTLRPKVEFAGQDGVGMPWEVCGLPRAQAQEIARVEDRPIYGGTPADASVVEAIAAIRAGGQEVLFYPFILMEQMAGNTLPDPYSGGAGQAVLPWRGRITTSLAPGIAGGPDRTAQAEAEVALFFGDVQAGDFALDGARVIYSGPDEWSYRRFILHYAWLCKAAGGVDAFCVGSEMRGLTQIRGAGDAFVAVAALRALAADVRAILGPECKISYAADWSEYFGYLSPEGNRYFHLDPFWADETVDFIGIDNYMPLSDWRDGADHADAGAGSIHAIEYLRANIEGGEGFDWFYPGPEAEAAQVRMPITDGAYGEPWVFRYKDLRSWWSLPHFDRVDGVRAAVPSPWVPGSKPFWFTEFGCAAIDKGTNQPNVFLDPKSSESRVPKYSSGRRDDLIQMQYLRAHLAHWADPVRNPVSDIYGGPMVDMARAHVWAWDARPFPQFPANRALWSDGDNWARGHWVSGRVAAQPLASVVAEICAAAGVADVDVSGLHGLVRGYVAGAVESARASLQPLMLAHGFDAVERDGRLIFRMRDGRLRAALGPDDLAVRGQGTAGAIERVRAPRAELAGRVRIVHVEAEGDFETRAAEAVFADAPAPTVAQTDLPMLLTRGEARAMADRWLAEARISRDGARFALPPSSPLGAGDVVRIDTGEGPAQDWRIDRIDRAGALGAEAVRIEAGVYLPSDAVEEPVRLSPFVPPVPVLPLFLDLPLMTGEEVPHAPHVAVRAVPWPGSVAVYSGLEDAGYALNRVLTAPGTIGVSESALSRAAPWRWDRGPALRVRMAGPLASAAPEAVLAGANLIAIGDGAGAWELLQFAQAQMVGPDLWDLSVRLRGQFGTEAVMPEVWPAGMWVVAITPALEQIDLPEAARGLARHYRIGPALRPLDDPSFVHEVVAFAGNGLRPYAPAHLRAVPGAGGIDLSWVRRTRVGGDSWAGFEVPLGEESEAYALRVIDTGGAVRREVVLGGPGWSYADTMRIADGVSAPYRIEVAQISGRFGAGPFTEIEIDG